jgi:hypothetical protein
VLKIIIGILLSLGLGGAITVAAEQGLFGHNPSHTGSGHTVAAPEIDPASAMSGLTLLLGGLAVLRGRSSKKL